MSGALDDRRVHARFGVFEVVRYDKAGKWYIEETVAPHWRRPLTVDEAVREAVAGRDRMRGVILLGVPGGSAFDRKVSA